MADLSGGDGPLACPFHSMVNVPVPHVIDGAPGAPHNKGAQAKDGEEGGVGQTAGRGRQGEAPPTRPQQ
jgi:hypothetical protein